MKRILHLLLPATVDNTLHGSKVPLYVFIPLALLSTVRSVVHLLASDGGAGSIAGMDLTVSGADGIVFAFALWGSSQLLFAFVQLAVAFRYRSLVPAMYVLLALEILLRMLVGVMRPVSFAHTPPGEVGNMVILPLALVMLALSLWSGARALTTQSMPG